MKEQRAGKSTAEAPLPGWNAAGAMVFLFQNPHPFGQRMKTFIFLLLLSILLFSSCGKKGPAGGASAAAVNRYCLVEPQHEIDPDVTLVYEGKTYGFCCKDCIPKFKGDPKKYIAAFEARGK